MCDREYIPLPHTDLCCLQQRVPIIYLLYKAQAANIGDLTGCIRPIATNEEVGNSCGSIIRIPAIIGFISLFGIATRNGMLLISRYNSLREDGKSLKDTIIEGSVDRLNPIIMTALTSMLALIPLAIGGELPGNEIQSPMAKVILGGLLSSTLLNMFVIPGVYLIIERKKGENRL